MKIETASVKVMRSLDYGHFEVCLSVDLEIGSDEQDALVDALRKLVPAVAAQLFVQILSLETNQNQNKQ